MRPLSFHNLPVPIYRCRGWGKRTTEFGAATEDIASTIHSQSTCVEALQEAAMIAQNCSIYTS